MRNSTVQPVCASLDRGIHYTDWSGRRCARRVPHRTTSQFSEPSTVRRQSQSSRAGTSCRSPSPAAREGQSCHRLSYPAPPWVSRPPAPGSWRLVHSDVGWRLCDLVIKDISMAAIMQSRFNSILPPATADLEPLLDLLHREVARISVLRFNTLWQR